MLFFGLFSTFGTKKLNYFSPNHPPLPPTALLVNECLFGKIGLIYHKNGCNLQLGKICCHFVAIEKI